MHSYKCFVDNITDNSFTVCWARPLSETIWCFFSCWLMPFSWSVSVKKFRAGNSFFRTGCVMTSNWWQRAMMTLQWTSPTRSSLLFRRAAPQTRSFRHSTINLLPFQTQRKCVSFFCLNYLNSWWTKWLFNSKFTLLLLGSQFLFFCVQLN